MVDAAHRVGLDAGDVLAVADRADERQLLAARHVDARAGALYSLDDGRDVVIGGRLLHHNQHGRSGSLVRAFNGELVMSARLADLVGKVRPDA